MIAQPPSTSAFARRVVNPLGFTKVYNFWLYIIFGGALTDFVLARFSYLNFSHNFCPADGPSESGNSAAPGECYYYLNFTQYKVGILLHLGGILPASLIAVAQFTPFIRHRWIIVHRIGGYAALLLFLVSLAGAFMIMRHAFGGGLEVQSALGVLGLSTLACFIISYINVKLTAKQGYYVVWTCARIAATITPDIDLANSYPACAAYVDGTDPDAVSAVAATFGVGDAANMGAAFNAEFGMALWLSLELHAIGVEVYLHLTPREAQRLRQVSYQKQLESGMRNPGSAGLTADRLGDAHRWSPDVPEEQHSTSSAEVVTMVSDSVLDRK
ncbi:hypothetical protein COCCADRAFT_41358 [Bipolaris zeicola 26-R-13]|uniref:DUF2306 domain-containing protein n=1 Tax=Cochliobolus carbonum (strain 26-R-13) TaxID=930089 RepID=W6YA75_COCC2|nr:uncharacterized protein COCCADRAFT_41358 [Bipolaris zeicola 26-R-13]EUC28061.1 hypothetical protein COCCADRAFT_41358 [Bipolaris zeicola 26-R-13]